MTLVQSWCADIEEGAQEQVNNLASLPFAHRHIAIMPDCHQGYGMPIGGVLATDGVVIPNAVGVDIGCGVRAVRTNLSVADVENEIDHIMSRIEQAIPTGFNHRALPYSEWGPEPDISLTTIVSQEYKSSLYQMGTLGGGNHFIEMQADEEDNVWFMLHSGSRNLGFRVAKYYNDLAIKLNKRWHTQVPKEWDLAFLPIESDEAKRYMAEMALCLEFARENRWCMMRTIAGTIGVYGGYVDTEIDVHHNYAAWEHHFGKNVLVHRKGAVRARAGEVVLIPGSMGTSSYVGEGLGNPNSFQSCSHGAGRTMGRRAAKRAITAESVIEDMQERKIAVFKPEMDDIAEECRQAYKDIDAVMAAQQDLVAPLHVLRPIAVIKA